MDSNGTIDITNIVNGLKSTFVTWATAFVYGEEIAVPGLEWVALPVVSTLDKDAIEGLLNLLAGSEIMEAFFLNTSIKKASQAQDYINTLNIKNNLPETATEGDFANAEQNEISAFRNFVLLTD